jgi:hypothetical protein
MSGFHQHDIDDVQADLTDDPCENEVRNCALRELVLARALYRCGDCDGLGEEILRNYARDMRGHFVRHARAVLSKQTRGLRKELDEHDEGYGPSGGRLGEGR